MSDLFSSARKEQEEPGINMDNEVLEVASANVVVTHRPFGGQRFFFIVQKSDTGHDGTNVLNTVAVSTEETKELVSVLQAALAQAEAESQPEQLQLFDTDSLEAPSDTGLATADRSN